MPQAFTVAYLKQLAQLARRGMFSAIGDGLQSMAEHLTNVSTAELGYLDALTPGTSAASKAMVRDSSNLMDGVPVAEFQSVDPSQKATLFDDFLAAAIDARWSSTAGAGTANAAATTVAGALNGNVTIKSASDDGTHAQNGSTLTTDQLNNRADQGGLVIEARMKISDVSEAAVFIGFTDTISTTVELPIFMNAADLDSDADNACGLIYDVDATTDRWYAGGVKATVDTVPTATNAIVPVDDTWFIARVEVSAAGAVTGYINGTLVGTVANAVTITTPLTPSIVVANRSANQVTLTLDYVWVQGNR